MKQVSVFAACVTAALTVSGCGLESVREFECGQNTARSAHIDSRLSTSFLTTVQTRADGTKEEKTYALSRYRGTGLEQIKEQARNFCDHGTEPPGYTK
ncbi:MAG: hypothetical protein LRZ85_04350 [Alphaproteobacteria bacterium]|nr:hypothetical protein [Alphaproteobacteria bacterium]MCD8520096.1 hypothetical protein [Alphaproteobacteria bacterium]MCD8570733.1 hypothetical protein [Alphaproteobacteria bacterium]